MRCGPVATTARIWDFNKPRFLSHNHIRLYCSLISASLRGANMDRAILPWAGLVQSFSAVVRVLVYTLSCELSSPHSTTMFKVAQSWLEMHRSHWHNRKHLFACRIRTFRRYPQVRS